MTPGLELDVLVSQIWKVFGFSGLIVTLLLNP